MKNNRKAIYSGTFDPITIGHIDIIKRALNIFDELIIAVASSKSKNPMFDLDKRVQLVKEATLCLKGVRIMPFDTLLVDLATSLDINNIIRGLRVASDFEYELQMSYANASINSNIDNIYLMPTLKNAFVSSTIVREIIRFGGSFHHLVPKEILKCI